MNQFIEQSDIALSLANMSEDARLWIFQSNRPLEDSEVNFAQNMLNDFLSRWTSHNHALLAKGVVALKRFIIIALDESKSSMASGCSIDSMTQQIQALAQQINADLMDRSTFYFISDDTIEGMHMSSMAQMYKENRVSDETLFFNNLVKTKKQLENGWLVPLKDSWHNRFV